MTSKKKIILRTLCMESGQLLQLLFALARLKAETHALIRSGEENPNITEISYYAAHDDLFFADENN